ncbi:hypothetical protein N9X46_00880 [Paracoccaceae bacterium]|nr:hypothetical protein [Paracoccaceae bacterium]
MEHGTRIKTQDLESRVLNSLRKILLGHEDTMKNFADAFHSEVKRRQTSKASNKASVQKDLLKAETGIKRCVDFLLHNDDPMDSIRTKLRRTRGAKTRTKRELQLQANAYKIVLNPNIGELYRQKVSNLKDLLKNDSTELKATEIVQSLIDRIDVASRGKRDESILILSAA